jgi:hypothetical protein
MQIPFKLSLLASAVVLAGCGGGGPGGSNLNTGNVRTSVSYETPTQINHFVPLTGQGITAVQTGVYTQDLNKDSVEEVVVAGSGAKTGNWETDWRKFNMQVYGWNTGSFTNETNAWFSGTDNVVQGHSAVNFADFNGDTHVDMFVNADTDTDKIASEYLVYFNSGNNSFVRTDLNIPTTWSHDSEVYDFNGDGIYDIFTIDYAKAHTISFGTTSGSFTSYSSDPNGPTATGASGISIADYLNDGSTTIVMTDSGADGNNDTALFSYSIVGGQLELTKIAQLPGSRFGLEKWDSVRHAPGHAVRSENMDFNNDGLTDIIVFEWMWNPNNDIGPSEVQFLRNDGGGNFTDVTDTVLVNYDHQRNQSYTPLFIDVNNDGLLDIFLSSSDYPVGDNQRSYHDSTRVLVQTVDGKFVEKYADVGSDFSQQLHAMTANSIDSWTQPIQIVKGPNNELYLFGTVLYVEDGSTATATYLSKVGSTGTITPQSVSDVIGSVWPYLTDAQKNQVLAQTSQMTLQGTQVVSLERALEPVGDLKVDGVKINGNLSVAGLNNSVFSKVTALDEIGRNYDVDITPLSNNFTPTVDAVSQTRQLGFTATGNNTTYNFGADTSSILDSEWRFGFAIGKQQQNPWLNFDGMFGTVNSTQTVEVDVNKEYQNGIWHRAGIVQYQTDFTPGLVTRVDDLWAGYAVLGYKEQGLNLYGGLKPTLFSGNVKVKLPTDVDTSGNLMYTDHTVSVRNRALGFLGIDYKFVLDITKALEYNVNAQIDSAGNKQGNFTAGLPW